MIGQHAPSEEAALSLQVEENQASPQHGTVDKTRWALGLIGLLLIGAAVCGTLRHGSFAESKSAHDVPDLAFSFGAMPALSPGGLRASSIPKGSIPNGDSWQALTHEVKNSVLKMNRNDIDPVADRAAPLSRPSLSRGAFTGMVLGTIGLPVLRTPADAATFSLKGIPGIGALTGADAPPPELGVIGKGQKGDKPGRLNNCVAKSGCISSFSNEDKSYIPPWTYIPDDVIEKSSFSGARKEEDEDEEKKTVEEAQSELKAMLKAQAGATIIKEEPRYLRAEFEDALTGVTDDVEFLFSTKSPIVNYRSAPRTAESDKRQRERMRDLRKAMEKKGWKSVGRLIG